MPLDPQRLNQVQVDQFQQQILQEYITAPTPGDKALLAQREALGWGDDHISQQLREKIARAEGRL